jgi:hypothetical protein
MASISLTKICDLINRQLIFHDKLSEYLFKARSLSCIGSHEDLSEYTSDVLQGYFWTLTDLLKTASSVNQEAQKWLFAEQQSLQ